MALTPDEEKRIKDTIAEVLSVLMDRVQGVERSQDALVAQLHMFTERIAQRLDRQDQMMMERFVGVVLDRDGHPFMLRADGKAFWLDPDTIKGF